MAGVPFRFKCSKCRREGHRLVKKDDGSFFVKGSVVRVCLTGKIKPVIYVSRDRLDIHSREYVCKDCNHKGYSRHIDLMPRSPSGQ